MTYPFSGGVTIHSNQTGCIFASDYILITKPFVIENGANVHIAIHDALCDDDRQALSGMPPLIDRDNTTTIVEGNTLSNPPDFKVFPNPAYDYVEIQSNQTLVKVSIINSNGVCVYQGTNTYIPVYHLPSGIFVVCATTEDGQLLQEKLIKQ